MEAIVRGNITTTFGEGPVWDHENNCLYMVDLAKKQVLAYYPETGKVVSYTLPKMTTSFLKYSKDELILLMMDGLYLYHLKENTIVSIVKPNGLNERILLNDAKCDSEGRIWTGSVDDHFKEFKESEENKGKEFPDKKAALYCIDTNLEVNQVKDKLILSNGLEWDPDKGVLYHVDSAKQSIFHIEYDEKSKSIVKEEVVYTFDEMDGFPDGMTIDRDGMIWVALFKPGPLAKITPKHGVVAKIDPINKKWVDSIILPVSHVTSCTFGGEGLNTLFITTALEPLPERERAKQPLAGRLFSIDLNVGGFKANSFKGNLNDIK